MTQSNDQIIEVTIDSLSYGGRGVARHNGVVVFVTESAPGDRARVRITNRRKKHLEGEIIELIEPSPHRVKPPHPDPGAFGGCTWQFIDYEEQLRQKHKIVCDAMRHIAGMEGVEVEPTLPSPELWRYRNKIEMTFSTDTDGQIVLGFHKPGCYHTIFDVPTCLIGPEEFDQITAAVRSWVRRHKIATYDPRNHEGILRHLIMRKANASGEILVTLLTKTEEIPDPEKLLLELRAACPSLSSFIWGINSGRADVARLERVAFQWGDGYLNEKLDERRYRVSGTSFFQTNTWAAEVLYRHIRDAAELSGKETLFDAYCGTGAIGLYLADQCKRVVGIDEHKPSIWDARSNAKLNGFDNCTFLIGAMRYTLPLVSSVTPNGFDRLIVDPPRSGMDKQSLRQLVALNVPLFVYVSCNPTTMSRDIQALIDAGYKLESVQPVDMFPHTFHVETVTKFRK